MTRNHPHCADIYYEYHTDRELDRDFMLVWKELRKGCQRNVQWIDGVDVSHSERHRQKWYRDSEGEWVFDLWYLEERRMLLSRLEAARMVYMLEGKSASNRERSRSRVPEGVDIDIDQLAELMSHTSPDPNL